MQHTSPSPSSILYHMPSGFQDGLRRMLVVISVCFCMLVCNPVHLLAQNKAASRAALRYEVDAKRTGTDPQAEDAIQRSREFIRIDSTYYVGYLYEGIYKYNHAADLLGFKNAALPLERALYQMERDYRRDLSLRTRDIPSIIAAYPRWIDYALITDNLNHCYLNTEEPEKSFALLQKYVRFKFQFPIYDAYNYLMWVVHRNRFYTSKKYDFLKDNIDANETLANQYLDSGMYEVRRNRSFNDGIMTPGSDQSFVNAIYHYKCILYSYAMNIDSAEYYYKKLRDGGQFPHNNYATFQAVIGNFGKAAEEYQEASGLDGGEKRLQEWIYYGSILDIYKSQPKRGEAALKDMIKAVGSTPGFGWYNIALARCLYYDGQIKESERYIDKAAGFKELHIGTTLGQSHYDFSIQLNKLMTKNAELQMQKFQNENWWYNPAVLTNMAKLSGEKFLQQFLIINQFSQNPERDRVIYKLFSTESTVSWDEVWYLIRDFSTRFFLTRYEQEIAEDNRPSIKRYFQLFKARLMMNDGDTKKAYALLSGIDVLGAGADEETEKLFYARTFEALANCAEALNKGDERDQWLYKLYSAYPQLVPYIDLPMPMHLVANSSGDEEAFKRLKACNIRWTEDRNAPTAYVSFRTMGDSKVADYWVTDAKGNYIVPRQFFAYKSASGAGIALAYRLFGVGGKNTFSESQEDL